MDPLDTLNQPTGDPLSAVKPLKQAQLDPETSNRRASLYGFAKYIDEPLMDGQTVEDSFLKTHQASLGIINTLGESELRREVELKSLDQTVKNLSSFGPEIGVGVESSRQALIRTLQEKAAQKESDAAEKAWAENVALLRDQGKDDLADLSILAKQQGSLWDSMTNRMSSRAFLQRAIEDADVQVQDRGWFFGLVDHLMTWVPFSNAWANTDNFQTESQRWYDNIFSGERKQAEANSWWDAIDSAKSPDEKKAIMDKFIQGAKQNTSFLWGQNQVLFLQNLQALQGYVDPTITNVFDGVDNIPIIGSMAYKAFKAPFRITNTLKAFGANKKVADTLVKANELISTKGPQAALKEMGVAIDEVEDNIASAAFNPKSNRSGIDVSFERARINKEMDAVEKLDIPIDEKEATLGDLRRQLEDLKKPQETPPPKPKFEYKQSPEASKKLKDIQAQREQAMKEMDDAIAAEDSALYADAEDKLANLDELEHNVLSADEAAQRRLLDRQVSTEVPVKDKAAKKAAEVSDDVGGDLALDALEEGERAWADLIGDVITTERLSENELKAALEDMNKRAARLNTNAKDKRYVHTDAKLWNGRTNSYEPTFETGQNVYRYEATLGRVPKSGDESPWFKNKESANTFKGKTGIEDAEVVAMDGGYGVKIRLPFDETGQALGGSKHFSPMADRAKAGALHAFTRYLGGGKLLASDDIFGLAAIASDKRNRILAQINKNVLPKFYALNKAEKDVLGAVLVDGERNSKWFTDMELKVHYAAQFGSRADPTKFIDAYRMAQKVNDMDYRMRNIQELVNLTTQGYEGIKFGWLTTPQTGKVLRNTGEIPKEAVYKLHADGSGQFLVDTLEEGATAVKRGKGLYAPRLTPTELKALQESEDAYVMVRLQKAVDVEMGGKQAKIRYFLVPADKLSTSKLSAIQIPYKAGGHRMYQGQYFVKKAVTGKQPWGETFLDRPFTPTVSLTRADALKWAEEANDIQRSYKSAREAGMGEDGLVRLVQDKIDVATKGFPDAEEFINWMKKYGDDHEFEAVFDRELPSHYSGSGKMQSGDLDEISGINTFLETQGRMFTSGKGDILRSVNDWDGPAETIDPFKTLNSSLTHIARMSSFMDFKVRSIQKWIATFGNALDLRGLDSLHPMRIFLETKFRTGTRELELLKSAAEGQRSYIKRVLGWKSDFDLGVEASMRHAAELFAGEKPGLRATYVTKGFNWWQETKPINALQGLAFDATMGLFNIGQFPLQAQTSLAALSIDATKGANAMTNMLPIMSYMRKAGGKADLDHFVSKGLHKLAGFEDANDYKLMMSTLKKSGWLDNMMSVMKNDFGPQAAMGAIGRGVQDVRRLGRFFVDKAEEWNRAVAWQIAWRRIRENKAYAHLASESPQFVEKVRSLASTFAGNMDEAGAAWWQKNTLTKLPTQFMGYMARWHEMIFNKDLTTMDKFRFFLGQGIMYGTAGIPVVAYIADRMEQANGHAADISTLSGMASRGFWDTLIYLSTGADVSFSERAGIGNYPTDVVNELFGVSKYGEVSTIDITLGPTYQIFVKDFAGALGKTFMYSIAESGGQYNKPMTEHSLRTLARNISSLNNVFKAEAIWKYGQYTNRKGEVIMKDMPSVYGFAALLGISPGEFQELSANIGWEQDRRKKVDEWTEQVMIHRQLLADAIKDGNYDKADEISQSINFIMTELVDKELRRDVLKQVEKDKKMRTIVETVAERVQREQSLDKQIKENSNQ